MSRLAGSLASGLGGELLESDRAYSTRHALLAAASAGAATFVDAIIVEFKPEISRFAGKTMTTLFGAR
jgi:hypothetical protein